MTVHLRGKPKRKVSLIVSDLSGGGALRAFLLGQVLQGIGHDVEVIGFLFGEDNYVPPPNGIPVVSIAGNTYPQFVKSARKLLNKAKGDILYAVKPKPTSFCLSLFKKMMVNRPVILDMDDWELSWYGGDDYQYSPTLRQFVRDVLKKSGILRYPDAPLYVKWTERLVPMADGLTTDTRFLQSRFGGIYLPNGKDTDLFNPEHYTSDVSRERYGLKGYRILMFPGAPRPHKGIEDVLKALDCLNEPDLRLVIVGGNPYDDYEEKLVGSWARWIIKLPKFPVEKMPEVLSATHIIVVPQRDHIISKAQFPLKLTDGMAMAKPVISTRIGDIPEILADTGYLVDPDRPAQIAEKIQWIFNNYDEALHRGKLARNRCIAHYSAKAMGSILSKMMDAF